MCIPTAHPRRHRLPSSSPPTLVVTARPRRHARPHHHCLCCRHLPSSSHPPSSLLPSLSLPVQCTHAHCCCPPALIVAASTSHPPSLRPVPVFPAVRLLSSCLPLLLLPVLIANPTCCPHFCSYLLFRLVHTIMNKWT